MTPNESDPIAPRNVVAPPARAALQLTGVGGVRLRLYRRVIEIRDGLLALRPYLPAGCPQTASPQTANTETANTETAGPEAADPDAEALRILAALRQRELGLPPDGTPGRWAPVGPEMNDEVAWLSSVSRAYKRQSRAGHLGKSGINRSDAPTPRPSGSPR